MSDQCCGITYTKGESFCIKCGKPLGSYTDSAFVPEKDISDSPTVIIDMAGIAEGLRKNGGSEDETDISEEKNSIDSAFGDVLEAGIMDEKRQVSQNGPVNDSVYSPVNIQVQQNRSANGPVNGQGMQNRAADGFVNVPGIQNRPAGGRVVQNPNRPDYGQVKPVSDIQAQRGQVSQTSDGRVQRGQSQVMAGGQAQRGQSQAAAGGQVQQNRPAGGQAQRGQSQVMTGGQARQQGTDRLRQTAVKTEDYGKKASDKSIGMLVTCIVVIAITLFGLGAIFLFTYKYKISPDYNEYKGEAAKGFVSYELPGGSDSNGGGN
ncbi:hypothetical protein SAMN04487934_10968 [Eubacterium ruminantium]|nr:hypothetical protein SAMN04487934_10968 [Eubacterium ruminantium]